MEDLSATEAARRFSELLDAIEHGHETFTISRRGRVIARIGPASGATGKTVKDLIRRFHPDGAWAGELGDLRRALLPEERPWTG